MSRPKKVKEVSEKSPPVFTTEARENQIISLAYDLVEQRIRNGTATSQETCYFLRLGSSKEREERRMMEEKIKLLTAKTEALQSTKRIEELYGEAINAMRLYSGSMKNEDSDDQDI